jgi:hypothetical protein
MFRLSAPSDDEIQRHSAPTVEDNLFPIHIQLCASDLKTLQLSCGQLVVRQ